jgi:hypothetical protein
MHRRVLTRPAPVEHASRAWGRSRIRSVLCPYGEAATASCCGSRDSLGLRPLCDHGHVLRPPGHHPLTNEGALILCEGCKQLQGKHAVWRGRLNLHLCEDLETNLPLMEGLNDLASGPVRA